MLKMRIAVFVGNDYCTTHIEEHPIVTQKHSEVSATVKFLYDSGKLITSGTRKTPTGENLVVTFPDDNLTPILITGVKSKEDEEDDE